MGRRSRRAAASSGRQRRAAVHPAAAPPLAVQFCNDPLAAAWRAWRDGEQRRAAVHPAVHGRERCMTGGGGGLGARPLAVQFCNDPHRRRRRDLRRRSETAVWRPAAAVALCGAAEAGHYRNAELLDPAVLRRRATIRTGHYRNAPLRASAECQSP